MGRTRGRRVIVAIKIEILKLLEDAIIAGCRHEIACIDLDIDVKTFKRWKTDTADKRQGPLTTPSNKLLTEEVEKIVEVCTSKEYVDLPPSQIVPLLADKGVYLACESTFYKVLRERKLLEHRGKSKKASSSRPAPLVATGPNQIYSWDITYLKSDIRGEFFYLYMFMDIFSRKIVGFRVHDCESMEHSSNLINEICLREGILKDRLILHADNGGAMKGATMLATLQKLGIVPSFSRPRVSDDNAYSEALFKTLKYCPQYPSKPFASPEAANGWTSEFAHWYNNTHLHSGIKFVTPSSRHAGLDGEILARRKKVYEEARLRNPIRWSKGIRNWIKEEKVFLNYLQEEKNFDISLAS
jgi:transposase InsO family protein